MKIRSMEICATPVVLGQLSSNAAPRRNDRDPLVQEDLEFRGACPLLSCATLQCVLLTSLNSNAPSCCVNFS